MRKLLLFALACSFSIAATAQQMLPTTNEFRVNQNVPSEQYLPQVAVGASNDYVVVWKSWLQDDNTASIYFRRYNSNHIALSAELLVATGSNQNTEYVVKVLPWTNGRFIIAWNTPSGLNFRVLEPDNTLGATVPLAGGGYWDIAVRGNTLAYLYGSGNAELYIRAYDLGTNDYTGPAVLATENSSDDYDNPNIRFKSDGSLVAIYGRGNYPNRIYRKTFDGDLLAQINEAVLFEQNSSLNCIDVSTNASDEILISTKWGVNGTSVYMAWVLDANGTAIVDHLGVFSCSYAYYTSECALFDNGDFVIVMGNWLSLNDQDDYQIRGIYYQNYNLQNTGVVVMNTTTPGRQTYPAVEKRNDGGFLVVWEGNGFQGDTQGINARAYAGATFPGVQATSTAAITVNETGTTGQLQLRLGTQPTGNVVVDLNVSDATEAGIDATQFTFTTTDWDEPQTITVTGLDDAIDDGDISLNVVATMNAGTADATYAAMGPKYFPVVNRDNDATFTMPQDQSFCRDAGMGGVNVLINNQGLPITGMQATSDDQAVVDDAGISVAQVNSSTFSVSIAGLADNTPGTAIIQVMATDGLFAYTDAFIVNTLGDVPVIQETDGVLSCTIPGAAYQWFVDGGFIADATAQQWAPTENGEYTVLVVDANGCYNNSAPYLYLSTGMSVLNAASIFRAGPLTDVLPLYAPQAGNLHVMDTAGKLVAQLRVLAGAQTISLPQLAPGAYTLLLDGSAVRVVK